MTRDVTKSLGAREGNGASGDAHELTQLLVAVSEQRDRAAFAELFRALGPRLKGFALQLGCDPAAAEELVQDVMLTVWRRARQFDPAKGKAASWIYTIARNRRIDLLRRERYVRVDMEDPALVVDPDPLADEALGVRQVAARIAAALEVLPKEQAELLRLAFFKDLSHSHIAARSGLPLGTVKSRIRLAMVKLRSHLEDPR